MTTRRFALTFAAAAAVLGAALFSAAPAAAQYYGAYEDGRGRAMPREPWVEGRHIRRIPPMYDGGGYVRQRYGYGPGRHWRRWTRNPHPAYRPYGWRQPGWDRPRAYDYRY